MKTAVSAPRVTNDGRIAGEDSRPAQAAGGRHPRTGSRTPCTVVLSPPRRISAGRQLAAQPDHVLPSSVFSATIAPCGQPRRHQRPAGARPRAPAAPIRAAQHPVLGRREWLLPVRARPDEGVVGRRSRASSVRAGGGRRRRAAHHGTETGEQFADMEGLAGGGRRHPPRTPTVDPSCSWSRAVRNSTGTSAPRARSAWQTSRPSESGRPMSRMTASNGTFGPGRGPAASAEVPSPAVTTSRPPSPRGPGRRRPAGRGRPRPTAHAPPLLSTSWQCRLPCRQARAPPAFRRCSAP